VIVALGCNNPHIYHIIPPDSMRKHFYLQNRNTNNDIHTVLNTHTLYSIIINHTANMAFGGVALKSLATFLRFIEFCCAAIVLAISLYYLIVLHNHGLPIATYTRAVTGISGAALLYSIFALLLVCCVGGTFLSAFAIILDLAFAGAFIYIAWAYREGTSSCKGTVNTPLGSGDEKSEVSDGDGGFTHLPSLYTACKMETAAFAVAIVGMYAFPPSLLLLEL